MLPGFYWLKVDMLDGKGERWQMAMVDPRSTAEGCEPDGTPHGLVYFPALDFSDTCHEGYEKAEKVGPLDPPVADRTKAHRAFYYCTECGWAYIGNFPGGLKKEFQDRNTAECPRCGKRAGKRISTLEGVQ